MQNTPPITPKITLTPSNHHYPNHHNDPTSSISPLTLNFPTGISHQPKPDLSHIQLHTLSEYEKPLLRVKIENEIRYLEEELWYWKKNPRIPRTTSGKQRAEGKERDIKREITGLRRVMAELDNGENVL